MQRVDRTHIIDRNSPIPIYHQIATDIIERISLGEWKIGDQLPTEAELHAEYEVSPVTLRQALKHLADADLIIKHQGKGTFLRDTPKPFVQDLLLPGTEKEYSSSNANRIIEWRYEAQVPFSMQQTFQIDNSIGPLVFLRRVFLRQDKLLGLNDVWFPEEFVPDIIDKGLINGSITTTLRERYGYRFINIANYIESAKLNATEAALLEAPFDSPVLRVFSAHKIESGQVVEYSCTSWLGNLTRFSVNVDIRQ